MPDWTDTLAARQAGTRPGFLAADVPLEDQDPHHGFQPDSVRKSAEVQADQATTSTDDDEPHQTTRTTTKK